MNVILVQSGKVGANEEFVIALMHLDLRRSKSTIELKRSFHLSLQIAEHRERIAIKVEIARRAPGKNLASGFAFRSMRLLAVNACFGHATGLLSKNTRVSQRVY